MALTQFYEQANIFNALNCSVMIYSTRTAPSTASAISSLWCPSDGDIAGLRYPGMQGDGWDCSPMPMTFSSYAGNRGPLVYWYNDPVEHRCRESSAITASQSPAEPANFPPVRIAIDHRRHEQHPHLR